MRKTRIFGSALRELLSKPGASGFALMDELGGTDRGRIEALLALNSEEVPLAKCLELAFGTVDDSAMTALRGLRKRFNDKAEEIGSNLRFEVDSSKRSDPGKRRVWFSGPDQTAVAVERFSRESTLDLDDQPPVRPRVRRLSGDPSVDSGGGKRPVRVFVSYAHQAEKPKALDLIDRLARRFRSCVGYELTFWMDRDQHLDNWKPQIERQLADCDFGLFLLSPGLLASDFVRDVELPAFACTAQRSGKPCAVVGFAPVSAKHDDLRGLDDKQIYRLPIGKGLRDYIRLESDKRADFVDGLYLKLIETLDAHYAAADAAGQHSRGRRFDLAGRANVTVAAQAALWATAEREGPALCDDHFTELAGELPPHPQRTRAARTQWDALERSDRLATEGVDALDELVAWACDAGGPTFCAVLGQYGMGKTTTLKWLTRELLERRARGESAPLPIYIDLRVGSDDLGKVPTLIELLTEHIRRNPKLTDSHASAADLLNLVREQGALMIFDGLDEKIVHLPPKLARDFIRELWKVLPPTTRRDSTSTHGKLLISCRSHFFRDLQQQAGMFLGEGREGFRRGTGNGTSPDKAATATHEGDYRLFVMLPFSETQIAAYLIAAMGSSDRAEQALALIRSIHNLGELAERPVLLAHLGEHLQELELAAARGEVINAAAVYERVVSQWFVRDDGKHQLDPEHKRLLMQALAAKLHRERRHELPVAELEEWLDEFLAERPAIAGAYTNRPRELLKEDLRTATFLVRPESGQSAHLFRFAHTSLQEFFLAGYLLRELTRHQGAGWSMPKPSPETLRFCLQLLVRTPAHHQGNALGSWAGLLEAGGLAAELAFCAWLSARELGAPEPTPKRVLLDDADLQDLRILGSPENPWILPQASFRRAWLMRTRWRHVRLDDANFDAAHLEQAEFDRCALDNASVVGTHIGGCTVRGGSASELRLDLAEAGAAGSFWLLDSTRLPLHCGAAQCCEPRASSASPDPMTLTLRGGHADTITACAFSPDGRYLLSASSDWTLRLWHRQSGQCLRSFEGHKAEVTACAFAPDGAVLSASVDLTLRLWDHSSGQCLRSLEGHKSVVSACAFSPDGLNVLSGSWDGTLKLWDRHSGRCLRTFKGQNTINACTFSPDGSQVLSASGDTTLTLWDRESGMCLQRFEGHALSVFACAYSPDGSQVLSASWDRTVKLWDRTSGQCLRNFEGFESAVTGCGFSPDGRSAVTGSQDGTLKLWDLASGRCVASNEDVWLYVTAWAFSPDGRSVLSALGDNSLKLRNLDDAQCSLRLAGHPNDVIACAFTLNGRALLSATNKQILAMWEVESGRCLSSFMGHGSEAGACAFSLDGHRVLIGSWDGRLRLWNQASGQCLRTFEGHESVARVCAISPDGLSALSVSWHSIITLWDCESGKCQWRSERHEGNVTACAFAPNGRSLITGSQDGTVTLWDRESGQCLQKMQHASHMAVTTCIFSPEGRILLTASGDWTLKTWDSESGLCLRIFEGHEARVVACAFSPDGRILLSASADHTLKLWDRDSGQCLRTFKGHRAGVNACAFSPDGRRVLSASMDNTLKLWDVATGQCLRTIYHLPEGNYATFGPDHHQILATTPDAWRYFVTRVEREDQDPLILPAEVAAGPWPESAM